MLAKGPANDGADMLSNTAVVIIDFILFESCSF
jgi:hypothetical protein